MKYLYENLYGVPIELQVSRSKSSAVEIVINALQSNTKKQLLCVLLAFIISMVACLLLQNSISTFCALAIVLYANNFLKTVKQEKLLIIPNLGCQLTTQYNLGYNTQYIPWKKIKNLFVNEVISKQRIIFLLSLSSEDQIIPLFSNIRPRLDCIETIYKCLEYINL